MHLRKVIFHTLKRHLKVMELCHPFYQGVILPVINTKIHLTLPLRQLQVPSHKPHLCCLVAPILTFMPYNLLRMHVNVTV